MKIWIYVEGESDKLALQTLWKSWCEQLRTARHGIRIIHLGSKSRFFQKIGPRAAEKLYANTEDIVVGLPDLYPNQPYAGTRFEHNDMTQLKSVQVSEVSKALENIYGVNRQNARQLLERFLPSALKHDLEMLLLASHEEMRAYLRTSEHLVSWRNPVEDQNQQRPPKHIVEELFRTKSKTKHAYRDTKDASAILRNVTDIRTIIFDESSQIKCPVFKYLLDWIGEKTGIPAYQ